MLRSALPTAENRKQISLIVLLPMLITLSILLSMVTLIIVSYHAEKKSLFNTTLVLNYDSAAKMSHTITTLFRSMRQTLLTTGAYFSHSTDGSDLLLQAELNQVRNSSNYFNSLFWADETGLIRNVSPMSVGLSGRPLTTEAGKAALNSQKPYLSAPYVGSTNRLIVLMTQPIFDANGHYRGIIGGTIYLQEPNVIYDIFGSNHSNESGSYFYIVGPEGNLIYHPETNRLGEDVSDNLIVQKLMRGESGKEPVLNTKGNSFLAGYSAVAENGWGVVMQTPEVTLFKQLDSLVKEQLIKMLLPLAIMIIGATWIAMRLVRPFVTLSKLAVRLSEGGTVAKSEFMPHWNREAHQLSQAMSMAVEANERQAASLTRDATTDQLTGLFNRREMEEATNSWTAAGIPYSIIVTDIDHFKRVNDNFGHHKGDEVLKYLAAMMLQTARLGDICCRFGGEEFVILLPRTGISDALEVAEQLRTTVETGTSPIGTPITISLGLAEFPLQAQNAEQLFQYADAALYRAKRQGRNRTVIASEYAPTRHL